ncbi:MAG: hypothetical protein ABIT96_00430 [Ferruginibacter sp.]
MKNKLFYLTGFLSLLLFVLGCKKDTYTLGDLTAPSNLVINAVVVGQDATNPNGDGSGDVKITVSADNALSYKVDYDANSNPPDLVYLPSGSDTHKYSTLGTNTYRITLVAYGKGGTSSTITKEVTVKFSYTPAGSVITNLTGGTSKTWRIDKDVVGHFGVGPWSNTSSTPEWYAAQPNEKAACCNCFYTARFKFTQVSATSFTLQTITPDGAFTKTGALAGGLPGIPGSGGEACYPYAGGTTSFSFLPSTIRPANSVISLDGTSTFIGYGAVLKNYEIMSLTANTMYLRVQGTETGNAWYMKLITP